MQKQRKKKPTRAPVPRVRTGCLTCKIRHKKCDEARPSCILCTSTGRKCDGYQIVPDRRTRPFRKYRMVPTSQTQVSQHSLSDPMDLIYTSSFLVNPNEAILTPRERHYLDYFRLNTSFQFSAYFGMDFWHRIVPQTSQVEPALQHASIAMGALHWNFAENKSGNDPIDNSFPLQQCNRAISCLHHTLAIESRSHTETALVTCILFVSFAFFQGDISAAKNLLQGGLKVLRDWKELDISSHFESSTRRSLIQAFSHLRFHLRTFTDSEMHSKLNEWPADCWVESTGFSLSESIDSLDKAACLVFDIYALVTPGNNQIPSFPSKYQKLILRKLQTWATELKTSFESRANGISIKERTTMTVIQIWSEIIYIMVAVDKGPGEKCEMRYDLFQDHFQRAVNMSKLLLTSSSLRSLMPTFSIGTGIIPPLFFCAFRCRDWVVRRDALLMLRGWQCQEGIWKTPATVFILERLIEIESEGLSPQDIVPESARIESMHVDISPIGQKVRIWYRRNRHCGNQRWESEFASFSY
ncbi:hypothetical protein BGW36DRAFT_416895 [Talaromyces proteolyticus]|uniref:Zn(2)-C6 fungal-type domain-containing protein n=1 Tax=Talaromyces proteolyticus TaxID=1131652 RepID=A0AAD4KR41_9EURO|nr:uncharacterized protein BGW36DRAFT_416895 [Talaromyces proteolyticus]KAH8697444.1 hypothetical protein BGW36DRAFT_416895 [Talaromyces proteolyticus]